MTLRKRLLFLCFLCFTVLAFAVPCFAAPTFSSYWSQDGNGLWHVYDGSGTLVKNAWLCDDAVASNGRNIWYLIDENGNMISAGLVQDGTGNYYSLERNHDGYFGMLRYESKSYTADGLTVSLQLESAHNGSFAAIKNEDGIKALKAKYGLKKVSIDNSSCVYTSDFAKANQSAAGQTAGGSASSAQKVSSQGSVLTARDFVASGSSVPQSDMISYITAKYGHDGAAFFYYDSSADASRAGVVKTNRGITLASYKSDVIAAYGNGTAVDVSRPESTRALEIVYQFDPNGLKTYAKSCLAYFTADRDYAIYFCFKGNGQLSYIIYYVK